MNKTKRLLRHDIVALIETVDGPLVTIPKGEEVTYTEGDFLRAERSNGYVQISFNYQGELQQGWTHFRNLS